MPHCCNPWCRASFEVLPEDREMLRRFAIDRDPECCPTCRHLHRSLFRPRLVFHKRKSSLSDRDIISISGPHTPFPVYAIDEWWSDHWDPLSYGRPLDFSQPFFPQFEALHMTVPKMANFNENCENCEYCCDSGRAKNAYYSLRVYRSQDVYYSETVTGYCEDMCDCLRCYQSGELHQCVQCFRCRHSAYCFRCSDSRDCHFCVDLKGCNDCLFCWNLRNKSFHVRNQPVAKEEFQRLKREAIDGRHSTLLTNLGAFSDVYRKAIWPSTYQLNCEDCRGDMLMNCSRCHECYDSINLEDCRYCWDLSPSESSLCWMDVTTGGIGELLYNCTGLGGGNYYMRMCAKCRLSSNLTYCIDCYSCKNCFGCSGLQQKEYCLLNKQYTKQEYEELAPRVLAHMRATEEWGRFFPPSTSAFAYNESTALQYCPLKEGEASRRGWRWEAVPEQERAEGQQASALPDCIDDVDNGVCAHALLCPETGKSFRIIPQELAFYRRMRIPLPRLHPEERMARRRAMLNPYRLWKRACRKCGEGMQTSYSPDRPEHVYCETCYLKTVY